MADPIKRLPLLPAERALKIIAGRWKARILHYLFDGPKRLSELQRLASGVSQKVLVQQLRELEEHGVVRREVFREVPARVEYSATNLGRSLEPIILTLCDWGRRHAAELADVEALEECETAEGIAAARLRARQSGAARLVRSRLVRAGRA